MKKLLLPIILLILLLVLYFVFKFKGAAPAVLPPQKLPQTQKPQVELPFKLPAGFFIDIFAADLKNPRVMTFDPSGNLIVSIPQEGKVVVLPDQDQDGRADKTVVLADKLDRPHGLAFKDNKLYVAQVQSVTSFDYDSQTLQIRNPQKVLDLPAGGRHFTRTIGFRGDILYISVGSTCDVCEEKDLRAGTILAANINTGQSQIFAKGLRNSVFFTFHPQNGQIWATEMGRDFLGDNLPPDEINIVKEEKDYGWPYCYGNRVHDTDFDQKIYIQTVPQLPCGLTEAPVYEIAAHSAPLGLAFVNSALFPGDWQGDLLVAYHGSWNRSTPIGYKVVRLEKEGEKVQKEEDFITGFLPVSAAGDQDLQTIGRPADLAFNSQGYLFVTDDKAGVVYRVWR